MRVQMNLQRQGSYPVLTHLQPIVVDKGRVKPTLKLRPFTLQQTHTAASRKPEEGRTLDNEGSE